MPSSPHHAATLTSCCCGMLRRFRAHCRGAQVVSPTIVSGMVTYVGTRHEVRTSSNPLCDGETHVPSSPPPPPPSPKRCVLTGWSPLLFARIAQYNEDYGVAIPDLFLSTTNMPKLDPKKYAGAANRTISVYGVYDGHGGGTASKVCSQHPWPAPMPPVLTQPCCSAVAPRLRCTVRRAAAARHVRGGAVAIQHRG